MQLTVVKERDDLLWLWCDGDVVQQYLLPQTNPLTTHLGPKGFARKVLLDLSGITFMGTIGVGWLVTSYNRFRQQGGRLVVHSVPEAISTVFDLLQVPEMIEIAENEEEALRKILGPVPA